MSNQKTGTATQTLQTILVAVLLGTTGWLATATIQNREDVIRLRTQAEERVVVITQMTVTLAEATKTEQEVLRVLVSLKEADAAAQLRLASMDLRINAIEKKP